MKWLQGARAHPLAVWGGGVLLLETGSALHCQLSLYFTLTRVVWGAWWNAGPVVERGAVTERAARGDALGAVGFGGRAGGLLVSCKGNPFNSQGGFASGVLETH